MKTNRIAALALLGLSTLNPQLSTFAQGTAFTYQGRLNDGTAPATGTYDLRFTIYDSSGGPTLVVGPLTNAAVSVSNGLFTTTLNFGRGVFTGPARWLEIDARTNSSGGFVALAPRQPLTAAPYAIMANSASNLLGTLPASQLSGALSSAQLSGTYGNAVTFNNAANNFSGDGSGFLGTTDNNPLELRVNGGRGLRLEPSASTPNLIGGFSGNYASNTVVGAHIGGGGDVNLTNRVLKDFGSVGGGTANTASGLASSVGGGANNTASGSRAAIAGGENNTASATTATVSGGYANHATGFRSAVSGGELNTASAASAVVSGGDNNVASAFAATISGGEFNIANGTHAAIPGGSRNTATNYSFAAGRRAKATNEGTFVWADSTGIDFGSTAPNQFLVRAEFTGINRATSITSSEYFGVRAPVTNVFGGMYMETAGSGRPFYGYAMAGAAAAYHYIDGLDDGKWKLVNGGGIRVTVETAGQVGLGTTSPTERLHVIGNILASGTITASSDRNVKENFAVVNPRDVLDKVAALSISRWNFKDDPRITHVGPMAQDFYAAFNVGTDDKHIATVDADGVALAAIQGLNQKVEGELKAKDARIDTLEKELAELKELLTKLSATRN